MISLIREFLKLESAGGLLLVIATILALVMKNSAYSDWYAALLNTPVNIAIGEFQIAKPLLLWINDGLMAVFFFVIGLELKREFLEGELSNRSQIVLPAFAATGGMLVPAAIYAYINWGHPITMNGWAIPAATDIAFALGVLALLGSRVPVTLKLFLMALAILDDVGAIIIIALFYTTELSTLSLTTAGICLLLLIYLNKRGITHLPIYLFIGTIMWASVLKSGVHATLAGVILAFTIPLRNPEDPEHSPARQLEHELHPSVAYVILPLFAFANAGVPLAGMTIKALFEPVSLGIILGLFVGKQLGVFSFAWLAIKLKLASLPDKVSWTQLYGAAILCGIGFTMSLFIASLAFEHKGQEYIRHVRLGILVASLMAAVAGYILLRFTQKKSASNQPT
ncbi:MAG: Na+/H+ antiporter NhaA [Gammaproteobacteria bacterium]|nr:Na+/H+ antiporter NhaA [Gammaproteobacteria bacterium]